MELFNQENDPIKIIFREKELYSKILRLLSELKKISSSKDRTKKIEEILSKIDNIINQNPLSPQTREALKNYCHPIKERLTTWRDEFRRDFGSKLNNALKEKKFELKGNYPDLKVLFYTLQVNFDNESLTIWYGPKQEKIATTSLDIKEIVTLFIQENHKLTGRGFSDDAFLENLFIAYKISLNRNNKAMGEEVPIISVLSDYAFMIQDNKFKTNPKREHFTSYPREFFSYDLFRLRHRDYKGKELKLSSATRAFSQKRCDYLWIPSNEFGDGHYYAAIKFKEATNGTI